MKEQEPPDSGSEQTRVPSFSLATATGPEVISPTQYNASTGAEVSAGGTGTAGDFTPAPRQPDSGHDHDNHNVRKTVIGGGLVGTVGALLTSAALLFSSGGGSEQKNPDSSTGDNSGVPTLVLPSTEVPSSPVATNTLEPTATKASENLAPSYGQYKDIESLPFSDQKKESIRTLTKDCEPMIVTDEGMLCIENALMTRPEQITHNGKLINVAQLHSIGLDTSKYPEAKQMFDRMMQMGKYQAWKNQSGDQNTTFDQYLANRNSTNYGFETWAYQGKSDTRTFQQFTDDTYIILRFIANSDRDNILQNTGLEFLNEGIGDVLSGGIFSPDPGGIGVVDSFGTNGQEYYAAQWMGAYLAKLGANIPKNIVGGKYTISGNLPEMLRATPLIFKEAIPQFNSSSTAGFESIFTVTGTPKSK